MKLNLPAPLYWAGSCFEFIFTGTQLRLSFDADFTQMEPWITVELNGASLLRAPLDRGTTRFCLFRGMSPGVPKHVRIFQETQPIPDDPRRRLSVQEISGTGGPLLPVPDRPLLLEFIGDSLTSGEGIVGAAQETDWIPPLFSASQSWARKAADRLGADFRAVSQSGWGVCSGWDGDASHALPRWYEETAPLRGREPDAIVINLGTNDANAIQSGLGPAGLDGFEEGALAFLRQLRAEHPAAKLIWAYGMLDDPLRPQLERAVSRIGDAWYLPLPCVTPETMGARQHPGPLCHRAAAEVTANFLTSIL